jgi:hypothetical protein
MDQPGRRHCGDEYEHERIAHHRVRVTGVLSGSAVAVSFCECAISAILIWIGEQHAHSRSLGVVHLEQRNTGPACRRFANDARSVMAEMHVPFIASRIKEPHNPFIDGIEPREIWAFCQIAFGACQGKITGTFPATMLSRPDVFNVECQLGEGLREMAVFAPVSSASADKLAQRRIHQAARGRIKNACASALRTANNELARTSDSSSARCLGVRDPSVFLVASIS